MLDAFDKYGKIIQSKKVIKNKFLVIIPSFSIVAARKQAIF